MNEYYVPYEAAESEFTEKRSRFIGHIWRTHSESEAREYIEQMRRRYHDARHNCWCYLIHGETPLVHGETSFAHGEPTFAGETVRYSDDGEPQGTAGQPMLQIFQRRGVSDVCCVVTRYFGGILLGAGGLTRAYARAAKDTLDVSGVTRMRLWEMYDVTVPYALLERLKMEISLCAGRVTDTVYAENVTLHTAFPDGAAVHFGERLRELTGGTADMAKTGTEFLPGEREA